MRNVHALRGTRGPGHVTLEGSVYGALLQLCADTQPGCSLKGNQKPACCVFVNKVPAGVYLHTVARGRLSGMRVRLCVRVAGTPCGWHAAWHSLSVRVAHRAMCRSARAGAT